MEALWNLKDLKLYPLIAEFAVTLARHEECLSDFDWKGELQERGSMLHYETALQLLKSVNRMAEAQEIFDEAVSWWDDELALPKPPVKFRRKWWVFWSRKNPQVISKWLWVNTYRYIFSGLFTSINPSYFEVNYRGTRFWPIPKSPNQSQSSSIQGFVGTWWSTNDRLEPVLPDAFGLRAKIEASFPLVGARRSTTCRGRALAVRDCVGGRCDKYHYYNYIILYIHIYIYIRLQRAASESESDIYIYIYYTHTYVYVHMCIYIYIYIC